MQANSGVALLAKSSMRIASLVQIRINSWSYPSVGIWWFGLNGRVLRGIEQAKQAA